MMRGMNPEEHQSRLVKAQLEAVFGPVKRIGGGHQSRVFARGQEIIKVYREALGLNRLEAANLRRAGFGDWVIDADNHGELEVLRLRHFPGHPLGRKDLPAALTGVERFMQKLHAVRHNETVNLAGVRSKLERFARALPDEKFKPLLDAVRQALRDGTLEVEACLCHLDLHRQNILVTQTKEVLVVDWTRSDWDDPARDWAIFFTGSLNLLPRQDAVRTGLSMALRHGLEARFVAHVALQTLHDLYWFQTKQPSGLAQATRSKLPRALEVIRQARG